jgi:restriction endonuclease S subunit
MIRIGDISNDGELTCDELLRIEPNESIRQDLFLRPGDVLFPNRGIRTTAFAFERAEPNVIAGGQFFVLRPHLAKVHPGYLAWFLRSEPAATHFRACRKGTLVQTIQRRDITDLSIPLPSLQNQEKIVAMDALATEEQQLSARLSQLQSLYLQRRLLTAASASSR